MLGADMLDTQESRQLVASVCKMPLQTMDSVSDVLTRVMQIRRGGFLWFSPESSSYRFNRTSTLPSGGVREVAPTNCFCMLASAILVIAWTRGIKIIIEVKHSSQVMKLPCLRIVLNTVIGTAKTVVIYPGSWGGPAADSFNLYSHNGINWAPLETSKEHAKKHCRPTSSTASTYGFTPHTVEFAAVVVSILKYDLPSRTPVYTLLGAVAKAPSNAVPPTTPINDSMDFIATTIMSDPTAGRVMQEMRWAMDNVGTSGARSWAEELVGRVVLLNLPSRPSPIHDLKFGLDQFDAADVIEASVDSGLMDTASTVITIDDM